MYKVNNRGCVTIVGYLLGVSEHVLERDYTVDYTKLQSVDFLDELKVVRSLNKVRQNVFKNYKHYKNRYLGDVSNTYVDEDLLYLRDKGYDLFNVSKIDSSAEYLLNSIKRDVDYLVPVVLDKLNMQYVNELKSLFEFPVFDKKSLLNFVSGLKGKSLPHGVIIPRYKRIQTSLQYLLSNDTTLYAGAFSLCNKEFSVVDDVIYAYDWDMLLDSTVYIDEEDIKYDSDVEESVTLSVTEGDEDVSNTIVIDSSDIAQCNKESVCDIKKGIIENAVGVIATCDKYFVDCDNIDFFKFLSMLDTLEEEGVKDIDFYLYTDLKATYLWNILDDVRCSDAFNFIYKKVDRVKGNKSVVDLVITVDVCKEVMEHGSKKIGLISSDSDFYGVLDSLEGVDFVVGYNSECTSSAYLHYLGKNDYKKFDVKVFEKEETLTNSLDKIVTYMVLSILSNIAMSSWDIDVLIESVRGGIEKESSFTISDDYLRDKIANVISDLRVSVVDSVLYFSYEDISIKINK